MYKLTGNFLLVMLGLLVWTGCGPEQAHTLGSMEIAVTAASTCGDGHRASDEACDDGNSNSGDGCSSTCQVENGYACTDANFSLDFTEHWQTTSANPSWTLAADRLTVRQGTNSDPAVYMTTLPVTGATLSFNLMVDTTSDDDFIGWVVGFNRGDTASRAADFLLFDWKQANQGLARLGLAMSRVRGVVNGDALWAHSGGVTELARAINLGSTGWVDRTTYRVTMRYEPSRIRVWVNDALEFDVTGSFPAGKFGFYTYSQEQGVFTLVSPTTGSICGLDPNADPDGDGVPTRRDPAPFDPTICGDADGDGQDDCQRGRWVLTSSMSTDRLLHTAVLLPGGRVLVAGGFNRSSELYDPATGTWTRTGDTLASHRYHTMTLLQDGRVLITGGGKCPVTGATAEVYDPAAGRWRPTGSLLTDRTHHAAALIPGGKVLVMGGIDNGGRVLSSAELYDPATGTWSATGRLVTARRNPTATLLPGGRVLVAGGRDGSGQFLRSAEVYDPASGTWAAVGSMSVGRSFHTATPLVDGKVLVAGGGGSQRAPAASAEVYDPATGTWTATGSMATPRRLHTATRLRSGKVLVAGGYHEFTGILTPAEVYDPATGTWSETYSMNVDRYYHTATLLPDGRVLAVGGASNTDQTSAELYTAGR